MLTSDYLSEVLFQVLEAISTVTPKQIQGATLPLLFRGLPDRISSDSAQTERVQYLRALSALRRLCVPGPLFETLVVRLTTKLELLCASHRTTEAETAYAFALIATLSTVLDQNVKAGHAEVQKYAERLVPRIYAIFMEAALGDSSVTESSIATDARLIEGGAKLITMMMRSLPAECVVCCFRCFSEAVAH